MPTAVPSAASPGAIHLTDPTRDVDFDQARAEATDLRIQDYFEDIDVDSVGVSFPFQERVDVSGRTTGRIDFKRPVFDAGDLGRHRCYFGCFSGLQQYQRHCFAAGEPDWGDEGDWGELLAGGVGLSDLGH